MPSSANRVRIIGGLHRSRVVTFPAAPGLRPTPDRVRETLFNWLGQDLAGQQTLDLFAGTGALSLESLSRGATLAVAVDRNPMLVRALEGNAKSIGVDGLEAHCSDASVFLARETRRFDVVFLDPPFADDPWATLLPACAARLAEGGAIYAEAGRELAPPPGLALHRHATAGQVHYHLLRLARETRRFDVVFLDPPFADDPWAVLLPACAARLAEGGAIYAEAGRELAPPPGLGLHRHATAGQVHYHLLRLAAG